MEIKSIFHFPLTRAGWEKTQRSPIHIERFTTQVAANPSPGLTQVLVFATCHGGKHPPHVIEPPTTEVIHIQQTPESSMSKVYTTPF